MSMCQFFVLWYDAHHTTYLACALCFYKLKNNYIQTIPKSLSNYQQFPFAYNFYKMFLTYFHFPTFDNCLCNSKINIKPCF